MRIDTIGKKILLLRVSKKMTQEDLILSLQEVGMNISRSTISRIESDKLSPKYDLLLALATVLGIQIVQLVSDSLFF